MKLFRIMIVKFLRPVAIIVILTLLIIEIGLRVLHFSIESKKPVEKNRIQSQEEIVILTIGESTTGWQIFQDGNDTEWPSQLQLTLNNSNFLGKKVRIINEAIPAVTTDYFVKNLETLIQNYRPNLIIAMVGINDYDIANIQPKSFLENFKLYKFVTLNQEMLRSTEYRNKTTALRKMEDHLGLSTIELKEFILSPLNHTKEVIYARLQKDQANLDTDLRVLITEIYIENFMEIATTLYIKKSLSTQELEHFNFYKKMAISLVENILFTEEHSGFILPIFLKNPILLDTPELSKSIERIVQHENEYFHPFALSGLAVLKDRFQSGTRRNFNRFEYTRKNLRTIAEIAKRTKVKLTFMQYPRIPSIWLNAMLSETPIDFVENFKWSCGMTYANNLNLTIDPDIDFISNENMAYLCKPEIGTCFIDVFHFCPGNENYNFGHATRYGNSLIVKNVLEYLKIYFKK